MLPVTSPVPPGTSSYISSCLQFSKRTFPVTTGYLQLLENTRSYCWLPLQLPTVTFRYHRSYIKMPTVTASHRFQLHTGMPSDMKLHKVSDSHLASSTLVASSYLCSYCSNVQLQSVTYTGIYKYFQLPANTHTVTTSYFPSYL